MQNNFSVVDLPGTYSLISNSCEEEIARDYLLSSSYDCVVIVVDSTALERNLILVHQVLEITKNIVVCVNLLDEAKKKNIKINLNLLSERLGVPVVGTSARNSKNLKQLNNEILNICMNKYENILSNADLFCNLDEDFMIDIINKSEKVCKDVCVFENNCYASHDRKIDKILTSKTLGIPIMLLFLGIIFWITIFFSNKPSELLYTLFYQIENILMKFSNFINIPKWISEMFILGMYRTLYSVVAVMLPPMAIFFPLFTILEDLGYLPRIAFILDNMFHKCGTSGKQALTMCMGFGCNASGVIGCRIIESPKEKIVAIITNAFVPCNGRFPFLIIVSSIFIGGIFTGFFSSVFSTLAILFIIVLGIFMTLLISKILSKTLLKGLSSSFKLELPPYRKPQFGKIFIRSILDKTLSVLIRAIVIAAPMGIVIWLFSNIKIFDISVLSHIANFLNPFAKLIGLDGYILTAFILGVPANEIVLPIIIMGYTFSGNLINISDINSIAEILFINNWSILTAINVMIFTLLHFPCSTTLLTIKKETNSLKWTIVSFLLPTICGIIICFVNTLFFNIFLI